MDIKKIILEYFPQAIASVITIKKDTKTFIELFPGNSFDYTAILHVSEKDFADKKFLHLKIIHEISHFISGYHINGLTKFLNKLRRRNYRLNLFFTSLINLIGLVSGQTLKNELKADFKSLEIINNKTNYTKYDYIEFLKKSVDKQENDIILKTLFNLRKKKILKFT